MGRARRIVAQLLVLMGRSRTSCGLVLALLAFCLTACGSSSQHAAITSVCSFKAKERPAVTRELAAFVKDYSVPGAVEVVCTPQGTTDAAAGFSDLGAKVEMRPTDRFWIGSVTGTFVATVALQLVGEGKLRLGDTVERWLPGVVPRGREITIRELLAHTSGIPNYFEDARVQQQLAKNPRVVIPPGTLIARAVSHPLKFKPGRSSDFSSTNYLLVGLIIQKASGRSVRAELKRRIFAPLDLSHTTFESPGRSVRDSEMRGYDVSGSRPRDVTLQTLGGPWADLAIVSNGDDLARFFSALLGGKLLPKAQLRAMKTVTFPTRTDGLGIARVSRFMLCRQAWNNRSYLPGYLTNVYASDDGTRVVVVATNGTSNPAWRSLDLTATDAYCAN